jgi:Tfp pilus assembly protein PilX
MKRVDMFANQQLRRGMTSVLAMIYLAVISALAVGFYTAIDLGSNIANNQQYINRSMTAAEAGLAFGRYQLSQISLPGTTTQQTLLNAVYGELATSLNGTLNMGGNGPTTQPSGTPTSIAIPGQASNGEPNWMNVDNQGGQVYLLITQVPNTMKLQLLAVGRNLYNTNANGASAAQPLIQRKLQVTFDSASGTTENPIFNYGLVSYGELMLNGGVTVNGTNGGVLAITSGSPINVNNSNSFSGDFYWTSSTSRTSINWGSLSVDGYLPSSGQFRNHVHGGVTAPATPTFDTTQFAAYATTQVFTSNSTTLTNLTIPSGWYSFNNPVTINGVLYLENGANINFNSSVTINGSIVEANGGSGGTVTFDGTVVENPMSSSTATLPSGETSLTGTAVLLPSYNVTFNSTVNASGAIIGGNLIFDANTLINGGSVINLSTNPMTFNNSATITINAANTQPAGTGGGSGNGNITYSADPTTYTEVYP